VHQEVPGFCAIPGNVDVKAALLESLLQRLSNLVVIFNDEHPAAAEDG
jgi:hypothetical protein